MSTFRREDERRRRLLDPQDPMAEARYEAAIRREGICTCIKDVPLSWRLEVTTTIGQYSPGKSWQSRWPQNLSHRVNILARIRAKFWSDYPKNFRKDIGYSLRGWAPESHNRKQGYVRKPIAPKAVLLELFEDASCILWWTLPEEPTQTSPEKAYELIFEPKKVVKLKRSQVKAGYCHHCGKIKDSTKV